MSADYDAFPWVQLPSEDTDQYNLFDKYLSLGVARSLLDVYELISRRIPFTELAQLASDYRWEDRAKAHDLDQARTKAIKDEQAREQIRRDAARQNALARRSILANIQALEEIRDSPDASHTARIKAIEALDKMMDKYKVENELPDHAMSPGDIILVRHAADCAEQKGH